MSVRYVPALGLLLAATGAGAQDTPIVPSLLPGSSIFKLKGRCERLVTPEGDQTAGCDGELVNLAFASGNSSFIATIKDVGGLSFRGRDSAAKGDVATIKLTSIIRSGADLSPSVEVKAKGSCTYTNPNKGPVHVNCAANTPKGRYELVFVSDGD